MKSLNNYLTITIVVLLSFSQSLPAYSKKRTRQLKQYLTELVEAHQKNDILPNSNALLPIQNFVNKGADPRVSIDAALGRTSALHFAAQAEDTHLISFLVSHQIGNSIIDIKDKNNWTPLMWAAAYGKVQAIALLLKHGASIDGGQSAIKYSSSSLTPLELASMHGHWDAVEMLVKHGANVDTEITNGLTPLMIAAKRGDVSAIVRLLNLGANIEAKSGSHKRPLTFMAIEESDGLTPLMFAALGGHKDALLCLLKNQAKLQVTDDKNRTPLMLAAYYGHTELIPMLFDYDAVDEDGRNALDYAVSGGNEEAINLMTKLYASARIKSDKN